MCAQKIHAILYIADGRYGHICCSCPAGKRFCRTRKRGFEIVQAVRMLGRAINYPEYASPGIIKYHYTQTLAEPGMPECVAIGLDGQVAREQPYIFITAACRETGSCTAAAIDTAYPAVTIYVYTSRQIVPHQVQVAYRHTVGYMQVYMRRDRKSVV